MGDGRAGRRGRSRGGRRVASWSGGKASEDRGSATVWAVLAIGALVCWSSGPCWPWGRPSWPGTGREGPPTWRRSRPRTTGWRARTGLRRGAAGWRPHRAPGWCGARWTGKSSDVTRGRRGAADRAGQGQGGPRRTAAPGVPTGPLVRRIRPAPRILADGPRRISAGLPTWFLILRCRPPLGRSLQRCRRRCRGPRRWRVPAAAR